MKKNERNTTSWFNENKGFGVIISTDDELRRYKSYRLEEQGLGEVPRLIVTLNFEGSFFTRL